jgi:hypothetical protein
VAAAARALVALALVAGAAHAEPARPALTARPQPTYIRIPRASTPAPSAVSSRIFYVKKCTNSNCTVHYDPVDDSRTGASSIAQGTPTLSDFTHPEVWPDQMACVRATFAPFDIQVVDVKPSDSTTPYFLNLVGGKPSQLRSDIGNAGGVAPFDCNEIPNAITYTFDVYGPDVENLCWTVSQEVAHAFGLEHEFLAKDPMTYLAGELPKRFRDVDAPCGEFEQFARCECKSTPQNSYRHIVGMFGPGAPTPPDVTLLYPTEGKQTQPGFTAIVTALDDVRVDRVELYVDDALVTTAMAPFKGTDSFDLPTTDFGAGPHMLEVKAFDVQEVVTSITLPFTQGPPCTPDSVCAGGDVCLAGVCVPGPDVSGGLGSVCTAGTECLSHQCADAGEQFKHCVGACELGAKDSCPNEFSCIQSGTSGVCWPTPSSGCCDAGGSPVGPLVLSFGLGVLLLRRRR